MEITANNSDIPVRTLWDDVADDVFGLCVSVGAVAGIVVIAADQYIHNKVGYSPLGPVFMAAAGFATKVYYSEIKEQASAVWDAVKEDVFRLPLFSTATAGLMINAADKAVSGNLKSAAWSLAGAAVAGFLTHVSRSEIKEITSAVPSPR